MTQACPPPRAGAFIVTIYGDIAAPRDAALWMGALIEICAACGLSESVVRTAVSRLVAAGTLVGTRKGRRSFYRLTPQAKREFASAADRIYSGPPQPAGWLLAFTDEEAPPNWARLGPNALLAPDLPDIPRPEGTVLTATPKTGEPASLSSWAQRQWRMDDVAAAYRAVFDTQVSAQSPDEALGARLQLVHRYRHAVLKDPCLPFDVLPASWPASTARQFFLRHYLSLTPEAENAVEAHFKGGEDAFATNSAVIRKRISQMSDALS